MNIVFFVRIYCFFVQKWTLENSRLPEHLQRTVPQKPVDSRNMSIDDWNQLAWEATQVHSVDTKCEKIKFLVKLLAV